MKGLQVRSAARLMPLPFGETTQERPNLADVRRRLRRVDCAPFVACRMQVQCDDFLQFRCAIGTTACNPYREATMKRSFLLVPLLVVVMCGSWISTAQASVSVNPNAYVPATFAVGSVPKGVAISGMVGISTNSADGTVSLFNTCRPKYCQPGDPTSVTVGEQPSDVAISAISGQRTVDAYVTNAGDGTITVIPIDAWTAQMSSSPVTITVGGEPTGIAASADGRWVYISDSASSSLLVLDTASKSVEARIPVGLKPWGVAVSPDGSRAYVVNNGAGSVSVVNTGTRSVSATITIGSAPGDIAIDPAGTTVYATNNGSNSVSIIDTSLNSVVKTVTVGNQPWGVAATSTAAYVANYGSGTISVISGSKRTVAGTINAGGHPFGVAASTNPTVGTRGIFASNSSSGTLSIIAQTALTVDVNWTSSRSAKSVTGAVSFMPAVAYSMVATKGSTTKTGTCSVTSPGATVTCTAKLTGGSWIVSIHTRLPWQPTPGGQQNKRFTFS